MTLEPPEQDAVSVIIPVYNGAELLREALDSVLRQTSPPAEIIVIDDGSSDNSVGVARAFASAHLSIKVMHQANAGVAAARNRAAHAAASPWLAFLDHDDLWEPTKLERQVQALRQSPEASLCICATNILTQASGSGSGSLVTGITLPAAHLVSRRLHRTLRFQPSAVMLRRETLLAVGDFDPTAQPCEDWDLWLRLADSGVRFAVVPEPLTIYRSHATNTSNNAWRMFHAETLAFERRIAPRISPLLRPFVRRRMYAHFLAGVALVEREQRRPHLAIMLRSLLTWPAGDWRRHKIALHMLLKQLGILH